MVDASREAGKHPNTKHGGRNTRLYTIWHSMRQRCLSPTHRAFANYGGRGISICDRWNDFAAFAADMGEAPPGRHTLDRVDVNGNYEPSNCVWADWLTQANNKRNVKKYEVFGRPAQSITELSRQYGVTSRRLRLAVKRGENLESAIRRISAQPLARYKASDHA